jgi:predicted RNA binding protein YcfA (HicA-like mRNA interferase family)
MPMSGKEMVKAYLKAGWKTVKGGKGSHWKVRKGNRTQIIPNHKELDKGLERKLIKEMYE